MAGEINPAECKFILKNNGVTIVIVKKDSKSWSQLAFKEDKVDMGLGSLLRKARRRRKRILEQILWG